MIKPVSLSQIFSSQKKQKPNRNKKIFARLLSSSTLSSEHSPSSPAQNTAPNQNFSASDNDALLETQNSLVQHLLRVKELSTTPKEQNPEPSPLSSYDNTSRVVKSYVLSKHGTKEQNNIEVIIDDSSS
jgi:hypothetical protein